MRVFGRVRLCSQTGCERPYAAKGLCRLHYAKAKRAREGSTLEIRRAARQRVRKWRQKPEARYGDHVRTARHRGWVNELSLEDFKRLESQSCRYCGGKSPGKDTVGVDRLDSSLGYVKGNCVPCCVKCNRMKLDSSEADFKDHILKIASKYMEAKENMP